MENKTLILSDIHLGSPLFKHENIISQLLQIEDYMEIIFLGDFMDVWEKSLKKIVSKYKELIYIINYISFNMRITIVNGNHDPKKEEYQKLFPYCTVCDHYQSNNIPNTIFIHGDEFDYFIRDYSFLANSLFAIHYFFERFGFNIRERLKYTYYSLASQKDKNYFTDLVTKIELETMTKYDEFKNVVMGHTHLPKIVNNINDIGKIQNRQYINAGDWVHTNSYCIYWHNLKKFKLYQISKEEISVL